MCDKSSRTLATTSLFTVPEGVQRRAVEMIALVYANRPRICVHQVSHALEASGGLEKSREEIILRHGATERLSDGLVVSQKVGRDFAFDGVEFAIVRSPNS
jgi:hypothetical protein